MSMGSQVAVDAAASSQQAAIAPQETAAATAEPELPHDPFTWQRRHRLRDSGAHCMVQSNAASSAASAASCERSS